MATTVKSAKLLRCIRTLAEQPYQMRLLDGEASWDQSNTSAQDVSEQALREQRMILFGLGGKPIGLNDYRSQLAENLLQQMLCHGVEIRISGPDLVVLNDPPDMLPGMASMLLETGFVRREREILLVHDVDNFHGVTACRCTVWGDVDDDGRARRGLQQAYVLGNHSGRALDPSLHVRPELVAKVNNILSRPYQVRSRRSAKLLALTYSRAREIYATLIEYEDQITRQPEPATDGHDDIDWTEVSRLLDCDQA